MVSGVLSFYAELSDGERYHKRGVKSTTVLAKVPHRHIVFSPHIYHFSLILCKSLAVWKNGERRNLGEVEIEKMMNDEWRMMNDEWRVGEVFSRILNLFDTAATSRTDFLSNTVIASEAKQSSSYQEIASSLRSSQWHNNQFVCQFATVSFIFTHSPFSPIHLFFNFPKQGNS